ncbi:MAG: pyruvate kinase [Thermodesulfovibrionales bacterium]|jgi:pyruvate kinase
MRNTRNTKGIELWFTLGPSSREPNAIKDMIVAGATGARLTLSYSTPDWHIDKAKLLKETAKSLGTTCTVVADLEGEKYRVGNFNSPQHLKIKAGDNITFVSSLKTWELVSNCIPIKSADFFKFVNAGDKIVIGDASAVLLVESKKDDQVEARAIGDGTINPNRGILTQNTLFRPSSFTKKDKQDIIALFKEPTLFDAIALSFVSSAQVLEDVRDLMHDYGVNFPLVAKIETQSGVDNIDSIAEEADYLMAARGDLALFTPWIDLYYQVQRIAEAAKTHGKKWVLATQLAEGLERFAFPTRAEICDLSHWLSVGLDGAMLSYETAFGPKPKEALECITMLIDRWAR